MSSPLSEPLVVASPDWSVDLVDDASRVEGSQPVTPRRTWFGWSATSLPVAPLLFLGMLLGPQGLFLLTPGALAVVDPALPVAFATLGALLGLMPGLHPPFGRALGTAMTAMATTVAFIAAGFGVGAIAIGNQPVASLWLLPLVLGIAAASSLIVPIHRSPAPPFGPTTTVESEALASVVAGGLLLAFARQGSLAATFGWLIQACAVVGLLGFAGFLLLSKSVALAERRVFAVATLLLVGGAADALSFSALLAGTCAGLLWKGLGGLSRDSLQRDMLYALHPLVALVLVVAGARVEVTTMSLGLAAAYAALRILGRVASRALLTRKSRRGRDHDRFSLLAPGIFGIAFVLNAFRALGSDLALAVSIVVLGTILSEIAAFSASSRGSHE